MGGSFPQLLIESGASDDLPLGLDVCAASLDASAQVVEGGHGLVP